MLLLIGVFLSLSLGRYSNDPIKVLNVLLSKLGMNVPVDPAMVSIVFNVRSGLSERLSQPTGLTRFAGCFFRRSRRRISRHPAGNKPGNPPGIRLCRWDPGRPGNIVGAASPAQPLQHDAGALGHHRGRLSQLGACHHEIRG